MREFPRGVLFSDLDGTFLDRHFAPAVDAAALRALTPTWRVIWVSSRTAAELLALQRVLEHHEDAIGENGGVLLTFDHAQAVRFGTPVPLDEAWVVLLAAPIARTRPRVQQALDAADASAVEVSSLPPAELAMRSGYTVTDAERALDRHTSVLLTEVSDAGMSALQRLQDEGCTVVHGGRWTSIVDGATKGSTVRQWRAVAAPHAVTVAVGDADNDVTLLSAVDHPFVIRDAQHGPSPRLTAVAGARTLHAAGTAGWPELVALLPSLVPDA